MDITRSVSRFDLMVMLVIAVFAAYGVRWLLEQPRRGALWAGALALLVVVEFLPAPYPMSQPDTPAWYAALAAEPRSGAVLNLPMNWDRPGYLLYQTVHQKPLTVAYISREDPRTLTERARCCSISATWGPTLSPSIWPPRANRCWATWACVGWCWIAIRCPAHGTRV